MADGVKVPRSESGAAQPSSNPKAGAEIWNPGVGKTLLEAALSSHQAGRLDKAERGYRAVLHADPGNFHALHMLGVVAHQTGRQGEAVDLIGRALTVYDQLPEAHYNQAAALKALGRTRAAVDALRRAVTLRPDYPEAHLNLGVLLRSQSRFPEAEMAYRRAIQCRPDLAMAHNNLGSLLEVLGRFEEAVASWRAALEIKPDYAEAYRNLAQHRVCAIDDRQVATMKRLLAGGRLPDMEKVFICFALAQVYEARGDLDAAFAMLRNGNKLKRSGLQFSLDAERAFATSMSRGGCRAGVGRPKRRT